MQLQELVDGVLAQRMRVADVQGLQAVELARLHQFLQHLQAAMTVTLFSRCLCVVDFFTVTLVFLLLVCCRLCYNHTIFSLLVCCKLCYSHTTFSLLVYCRLCYNHTIFSLLVCCRLCYSHTKFLVACML